MVAPFVAPLVGVGASFLLDKLFGDSGSSNIPPESLRASQAQTAGLEQQTRLRALLQAMLTGSAQMPRSSPPPIFQFGAKAGGAANPKSLYQGMQPSLSPEFQALMKLAGLPSGTSAISSAGALSQQGNLLQQQQIGSITDEITQSLLEMAGRNSAATPAYSGPPVGPEGDDFMQFLNPPNPFEDMLSGIDPTTYIPENSQTDRF